MSVLPKSPATGAKRQPPPVHPYVPAPTVFRAYYGTLRPIAREDDGFGLWTRLGRRRQRGVALLIGRVAPGHCVQIRKVGVLGKNAGPWKTLPISTRGLPSNSNVHLLVLSFEEAAKLGIERPEMKSRNTPRYQDGRFEIRQVSAGRPSFAEAFFLSARPEKERLDGFYRAAEEIGRTFVGVDPIPGAFNYKPLRAKSA